MKTFSIDIAYCVSLTVSKTHYRNAESPSDLLRLLGETPTTTTTTIDHPKFDELRTQLEAEGFIKVQHLWWNGDEVINSFILNDKEFKVGDDFPCACSIRARLLKNDS